MKDLLDKHQGVEAAFAQYHMKKMKLMGVITSEIKALLSKLEEADREQFWDEFDALKENLLFLDIQIQELEKYSPFER